VWASLERGLCAEFSLQLLHGHRMVKAAAFAARISEQTNKHGVGQVLAIYGIDLIYSFDFD